jgi:hypothetical protein
VRTFVVYPARRAGWAVLREGDADPLHFADREAAIGYARCLAAANRPSALKVETAYGQVETGFVFDREGEPRPLPVRSARPPALF